MDSLLLPPRKEVFQTQYCANCLVALQVMTSAKGYSMDSVLCPHCQQGERKYRKDSGKSRIKKMIQCLCRSKKEDSDGEDQKGYMLEDVDSLPQFLDASMIHNRIRATEEQALELELNRKLHRHRSVCGFQECCALCGFMRMDTQDTEPADSPSIPEDSDADTLPIPEGIWQCPCGYPNPWERYECGQCQRTNRRLLMRHVSRQLKASIAAGMFILTEATLLLAGVCRVCGESTKLGATTCRTCQALRLRGRRSASM